MKLFSALFDLATLPIAVAKDIVLEPVKALDPFDHSKSETRKLVEKIDDDLEG